MQKSYEHVVRFVQETPWAVKPEMLSTIRGIVAAHLAGVELEPAAAVKKPAQLQTGSVGVLPLWGVMVPHAGMMTNMSGGVALDAWLEEFRALVADPSISSIILDIDSPGGAVAMVPETAAEIRAATGKKRIVAVANPEIASAAYWLASQAEEIVVPMSGSVGSVGVIAEHTDMSEMQAMKGIKSTYITAGEFKAEQLGPLTEDAKAAIQHRVDETYEMFISDIAKGRGATPGAVKQSFGKGRMLSARDALSVGMVDKIGTLDMVLYKELPAGKKRMRAEADEASLESRTFQNVDSSGPSSFYIGGLDLVAGPDTNSTGYTFQTGGIVSGTSVIDVTTFGQDAEVVVEEPPESEEGEGQEAVGEEPPLVGAAIPPRSTPVVDEPWDGNAAMGHCSSASDFRSICAWVDSSGDPAERQSYKFPHHSRPGGPANINGVNNAKARLSNADIPASDRAGVAAHLQRHQDDWARHERNTQGSAVRGADNNEEVTMDEGLTLEQLASRKEEILARMREIHNEAQGRHFYDNEQIEFDDLDRERVEVEEAIDNIQEREQRLAVAMGDPTRAFSGDGARKISTSPTKRRGGSGGVYTNAGRNLPENIYDLHAYRGYGSTVEEMIGLYREGARRVVDNLQPETERPEKAKEHMERLISHDGRDGAFSTRVLTTASPLYDRAFGKLMMGKPLNSQEDAALKAAVSNTGLGSETPVPVTIDPTVILTSDGTINPLRQIARNVTITGTKWQGISSDGVEVAYEAELTQVADTTPSFVAPTAEVVKAHCYIEFSIEVDQDWSELRNNLGIMFQDAKDMKEADKFLNGDGSGEPEGLVYALVADATSIVYGATQDTFAVEDVFKLKGELPPRFRPNAVFLANDEVYSEVRQFDQYGGSALWAQLGADRPAVLLGKSVYEASEMSSHTTTGSEPIMVYGDFSRGFIIVDRVGMNVELIPHVLGGNHRPIGARALYAYFRNTSALLTPAAFRILLVKPT